MSEKYETKPGVRLPRPEDARPKRFYETVEVEADGEGWAVRLDGRGVRTPARKTLVVPARRLADLIAAEWAAQGERIDAPAMPVTRLCFVALDRMGEARDATIAEVTRYASTDLLCFRAPEPGRPGQRPGGGLGSDADLGGTCSRGSFRAGHGHPAVDQDPIALQRVMARAGEQDDWRLTALAHATAVTGSAILGLALLEGEICGEKAFALSTVDEAYQASQWGEDAEAAERQARLREELVAVERMLRSLDAAPAA